MFGSPILTGACLAILAVGSVCALVVWRRDRRRAAQTDDTTAELRRVKLALENELLQARRMEAVGILAGSVVHNLNNLLAVILGHARMGAQTLPPDHGGRAELAKIVKAGTLAGELVAEISAFYRQADRARKPTDLVPVVRDTLKLLRDILPATVEIRDDLQPCGKVLASATGVQQVLMNLGSNALRALRAERGTIEVILREETVAGTHRAVPRELSPGRYALLSVRDDGRGMDEATLSRIFESYFSATADQGQMGIGLSTVCRILQEHDSATIPHSVPGAGTRFDIYFPLIAWAAAPEPAESHLDEAAPEPLDGFAATTNAAQRDARILVVDDEEMVAQVLGRGLRSLGFEVDVYTDPRDALDAFANAPGDYDAVVTDQIMPHMSGVRLTRRLHAVRSGVPVILCTGFRDSFNERQAREAGVLDFMLKPGSHRDLADVIERALLRRREGRG